MFNKPIHRNLLTAGAMVAALGFGAGCSSSASTTAGSTTSTVATDGSSTTSAGASTLPTTTSPGATTPSTLPGATTTVAPEPLVLRFDGLGPFDWGSTPAEVIDALTLRLGVPASNSVLLYEDASHFASDGYYESLDPPYYYDLAFPVGQTVCWTGSFCAEFGGASEPDLHFIGWQYSGPPHMMASAPNLTIGARWEDFPSMIVGATCYTTGGGTHHGILMVLAVDGGWDWLVPDGGGGWVENLPPREFTRVTFLSAGHLPFQAGLDC